MMHESNNRNQLHRKKKKKKIELRAITPYRDHRSQTRRQWRRDKLSAVCLFSISQIREHVGVRRGYSGQVQSINPLWIHSVGFNFTASKFIRTYRNSSHLWKGEGWHGEREGRRRKERSFRQTPYFVYRVLLSENL